jgi:glycerol uptake facilitator-like aquaporin
VWVSLGIGLSFGLAVMAAIYSVGHISGAHINPAVTLAFALTRHFPRSLVPAYVISQLLGGYAASSGGPLPCSRHSSHIAGDMPI